MARLTANPSAEASLAFDVVKPGTYRMRIKSIEETDSKSTPGNKLWKVGLEYTDPTGATKEDGTSAKNPGTILDSSLVVYPPEKQGKVRGFVECFGKKWGDLDSEDLIGLEGDVAVFIDLYQGEKSNKVKRYLPVK